MLLWRLQVHDHEGVLARRAVAEAHLPTAGGGSRPGAVHDFHRCESPRTAAAHTQLPTIQQLLQAKRMTRVGVSTP